MTPSQIIFYTSLVFTIVCFVYGYNFYYLLMASRRYKSPKVKDTGMRPRVAIHLPIYNEKYVVHRLIKACVRMAENYDRSKVRIVVLDDSDDETSPEVDEEIDEAIKQGLMAEVIRRSNRDGFKAGALQIALQRSEEDFIAVFDADVDPPSDFLIRTIPYFCDDDLLGIVQCRWGHTNRDYNLITQAVSIGIDSHFLIEQPGRYASGCFINFNGSGGVIRRKALMEAGGWQSDTLAEDLDASYRIQSKGYRAVYLKDLMSPGEVPPTIPSYKKQQRRWANGSMKTAKKLIPQIMADKNLGAVKKLEAFLHLTYYFVHPLILFSFILASLAALVNTQMISPKISDLGSLGQPLPRLLAGWSFWVTENMPLTLLWIAIAFSALAVWMCLFITVKRQGLNIFKYFPSLILLGIIGYGVSLSNTIGALKGLLLNKTGTFSRTPKYAIMAKTDDWKGKKYQVPMDLTALLELLAACWGGFCAIVAASFSNYGIIPIFIPYIVAYATVSVLTLRQSKQAD